MCHQARVSVTLSLTQGLSMLGKHRIIRASSPALFPRDPPTASHSIRFALAAPEFDSTPVGLSPAPNLPGPLIARLSCLLSCLLSELDLQRALNLQAPPVKEGPLFIHRTKGKGPLASSSFKKLYFSLTTEALSFAKTSSSKVSEQRGFPGWYLFVSPAIGRWKQETQDFQVQPQFKARLGSVRPNFKTK